MHAHGGGYSSSIGSTQREAMAYIGSPALASLEASGETWKYVSEKSAQIRDLIRERLNRLTDEGGWTGAAADSYVTTIEKDLLKRLTEVSEAAESYRKAFDPVTGAVQSSHTTATNNNIPWDCATRWTNRSQVQNQTIWGKIDEFFTGTDDELAERKRNAPEEVLDGNGQIVTTVPRTQWAAIEATTPLLAIPEIFARSNPQGSQVPSELTHQYDRRFEALSLNSAPRANVQDAARAVDSAMTNFQAEPLETFTYTGGKYQDGFRPEGSSAPTPSPGGSGTPTSPHGPGSNPTSPSGPGAPAPTTPGIDRGITSPTPEGPTTPHPTTDPTRPPVGEPRDFGNPGLDGSGHYSPDPIDHPGPIDNHPGPIVVPDPTDPTTPGPTVGDGPTRPGDVPANGGYIDEDGTQVSGIGGTPAPTATAPSNITTASPLASTGGIGNSMALAGGAPVGSRGGFGVGAPGTSFQVGPGGKGIVNPGNVGNVPAGGAGAGAGAGTGAGAGAGAPLGAAGRRDQQKKDDETQPGDEVWLEEDQDVWGSRPSAPPSTIH